MNHERQRIAEGVFKEARGLPVGERARFVADRCGSDAELAEEVRSLLEWNESEEGVLDRPPPALSGVTEADAAAALLPAGGTIGQYKILSVLGVGGMGVVYVAEQKRPQRTVALKVIRPGLASPSVLRRLEYEAEVLGKLQHPGIAQVIEAGTADGGFGLQPYFAMELVKGVTLDAYCAERKLDVASRLKLVERVCDAVEHAHRRGVIHRDLKPANILVDEAGQPKVLDFGVARAAEVREGDQRLTVLQTGERQLIGTVAYMSPEQVAGDPNAIDFRSDVYALGVILYELVAGKSPHDLTRRALPDAVRAIRDEEPRSLGSVNAAWRGDLDTIAAKALEKDRTRRYQSAAELGADIERFLTHRPISARPASAAYQFGKFARRNRALMAGTSIAAMAVVVGLIVSAVQYSKATRAAKRSDQVASVLKGMIGGIDPVIAQARDTTLLKDLVDKTATDLGKRLDGQPDVEAELRRTLGDVYYNIGEFPKAEEQYRIAMEKTDVAHGPASAAAANLMIKMTGVMNTSERHAEAVALAERALEINRKVHGPESVETADATANLGMALVTPDSARAIEKLKEAAAMYERLTGPKTADLGRVYEHLAQAEVEAGRGPEAEKSGKRAYEILRETLGPDSLETMRVAGLVGDGLMSQQRFAEAEPYVRERATAMTKLLPPSHPSIAMAWAAFALVLQREGKLGEAIATYRMQVGPMVKELGADALNVGTLRNNLGTALTDAGEFDAAAVEFEEAMRIYRAGAGEENMRMPFALLGLSTVHVGRGDWAGAEELARRAKVMGEKTLPTKHPLIWNAEMRIALCGTERSFAGEGDRLARAEEAVALAEEARTGFVSTLGEEHFNTWAAKVRGACAGAARACAGADEGAKKAAAEKLAELLVVMEAKPEVGAFPGRQLLLLDVNRTLQRAWACAGEKEKAAAAAITVEQAERALATRRAEAMRVQMEGK